MKNRLFVMLMIVSIMLSVAIGSASAQAYDAHFTTGITYVNVGTATTTTLDLLFYMGPDDLTPITFSLPALAPNAASSIYVGNISDVPAGFQGDAIMQSDQPMLVTLVQIVTDNAALKNRAISNGFSAGAAQSLIGTVIKGAVDTNSIIALQNADSDSNIVTVKFFDQSAVQKYIVTQEIEQGASFYIDVGQLADFPANFNGSAVATAVRSAGGDGAIVSSVMELNIAAKGLKAFEGVASGAKLVYMPSALCNVFGGQNTAYAIQNASLTESTNITVTYSTSTGSTFTATANIGPGAKAPFIGCDTLPQNSFGSAVVESSTTDVIAIGKAYGAGLSSAYNGVVSGTEKNVMPYYRWATDAHWFGLDVQRGQRVTLAIQNLGADFAVGDVITVAYTKPDGTVAGTDTITIGDADCLHLLHGEKCNSEASKAGLSEFGYWPDGTFGGAAIVTGPAGSQLTSIARVASLTSYPPAQFVAEDYNSQ